MNIKYTFLIIILITIFISCGVYIFFYQKTNVKIEQNSIEMNNSKKEEEKKKDQWNKVLGKGDTVIGDGENILKDKF